MQTLARGAMRSFDPRLREQATLRTAPTMKNPQSFNLRLREGGVLLSKRMRETSTSKNTSSVYCKPQDADCAVATAPNMMGSGCLFCLSSHSDAVPLDRKSVV